MAGVIRAMCAVVVGVLFAVVSSVGAGEIALSFSGGQSFTHDSDLKLHQSGTDLTFHDVEWDSESFETPFYYGARLIYWPGDAGRWGVALDFTHDKILLDPDDVVRVTGHRAGVTVSGPEPIGNTLQDFQLTHGVNYITLNGLHRWFPKGQRDGSLLGRLQPYAGVGVGAIYPHVEVKTAGANTFEYQLTGPAAQGLLGLSVDVVKHVATFLEYKLSYADVKVDLKGGGNISTDVITHHLVFGLSVWF